MLPQSLVQNTIIGDYESGDVDQFKIDWEKAAPIVNLNFFYENQLVNESEKYRTLLKPWTRLETPLTTIGEIKRMKTHEYYYSNVYLANDSLSDTIFPGSLVACLHQTNSDDFPDIMIVRPLVGDFLFNPVDGTLNYNNDVSVPPTFRLPFLGGLKQPIRVPLSRGNDQFTITDQFITYKCSNTELQYHSTKRTISGTTIEETVPLFLLFEQDVIGCRVYYKPKIGGGEQHVIDDYFSVPVNRQLNARLGLYEYSITIPNNNYPISPVTTELEFY